MRACPATIPPASSGTNAWECLRAFPPISAVPRQYHGRRIHHPRDLYPGPPGRVPDVSHSVPILMYHSVDESCAPAYRRWAVSPATFEQHLAVIHDRGFEPLTVT